MQECLVSLVSSILGRSGSEQRKVPSKFIRSDLQSGNLTETEISRPQSALLVCHWGSVFRIASRHRPVRLSLPFFLRCLLSRSSLRLPLQWPSFSSCSLYIRSRLLTFLCRLCRSESPSLLEELRAYPLRFYSH
ncbi:hypothetical protein TGGT1_283855 [Toxoplasma gondii GT1]|uniref:Uncharacterized protein n=1 Tax=Toxoplasma gondii (strain ATCC 50853 / GT1) TaxID=507601 RepID=S7UNK1_TOXGG|nr:hypothetical protein TGGT1_283855 [Toxoplasma gondii GT1]